MSNFYKERELQNRVKLKNILIELPLFAFDFFIGMENTTSILTRLNYAYDLRLFFQYIKESNPYFQEKKMKMLSPACLDNVTVTDIERFLSYLSYYESTEGRSVMNGESGKARKLATIRSFFKYYFNKGQIIANTASKVSMPKIHEKEIVRLEIDEVVKILDSAENGENLSDRQKSFNQITSKRDLAILTLFLGTGIRISELIGLNTTDVDFSKNGFTVTRKGGNRTVLYFSDEVKKALFEYLEWREEFLLEKNDGEKSKAQTDALFISLRLDRMSVRAVQNLVKKYSTAATPSKAISPHKLRSTYGTQLYRETQDIYIVADVLGHKDVNTTRKHYAAMSDELRRNAASKVKLRDKEEKD